MSATIKSKDTIFIHIPKTGGTSINCELNGSEWQTRPDFNYRHILYATKKSNSADIFEENEREKYKDYNIFTILRDPIERLLSEYYFLKDRKEFMTLLPKRPKNFYDYCIMTNTNNGMIKFLLGYRIYSSFSIGLVEYEQVVSAIDSLPIRVGVLEKFVDSLSYFSDCFGVSWSNMIEKKRVTINKPSRHGLTETELQLVKEKNKYDYMLYEKAISDLESSKFNMLDIEVGGNKYDYVLKYTERFILFESVLSNRDFLKVNKKYFEKLNLSLHNSCSTGEEYVKKWNDSVLLAFKNGYGDCQLTNEVERFEVADPLEFSFYLAECVNKFYDAVPVMKRIESLSL